MYGGKIQDVSNFSSRSLIIIEGYEVSNPLKEKFGV